ncbi:MAG: aminofutalosine synthase MqnE, partial [Oscillatoriales cyanobacterium RM1_1_9]|nr:aminofutalosine synthase MqnE [Oscillatoriales cyanobacterium RM1_1_9]
MIATSSSSLLDIRDKVEAGEWLSEEDGLCLYESPDIFTLGEIANALRERCTGAWP